jgi:threonyl-tRNA synthetase
MKNIEKIRHSLAHLLAASALEYDKNAKFGIGPIIENGFYYDILFRAKIDESILGQFERRIKELIKQNIAFKSKKITFPEANKLFKNQPFKLELLKDLAQFGTTKLQSQKPKAKSQNEKLKVKNVGKVKIYQSGDFVDLCEGPHIQMAREINPDAFKLVKLAGAYWRGNEKNPMLTRIYGVAFETKKEFEEYFKQQEEIEKRDHRKISKDLELFTISEDVGPGLILWLPKGTIIRDEIEHWAKETEKQWGYQRVVTPEITRGKLYEISGHLPYYKDDLFPAMLVDREEYYLKPMNCPHHHMIYKSRPRSYRELPLRLAEYGRVYRYEQSGELHGLMRVRGMAQNDSHIYCTFDQAKEEFKQVIKLHQYYYKVLGITDFYMELALRDPRNIKKYHGDEKMWRLTEKIIREAMIESNVPYVVKKGEAAFYGPKVDFNIKAITGKIFGASTSQLDLYMPERFGLEYIDEKGQKQKPAVIHRAPLGSHERFIGFLIEHFSGNFPLWLAPIQIILLPINKSHFVRAEQYAGELKKNDIRVEISEPDETLSKRILLAEKQKIPYIGIIGAREIKENKIAMRKHTKGNIGLKSIAGLIQSLKKEIEEKII